MPSRCALASSVSWWSLLYIVVDNLFTRTVVCVVGVPMKPGTEPGTESEYVLIKAHKAVSWPGLALETKPKTLKTFA